MSERSMPNSALGDRTCDCPFTEHGTGAGAVRRTSHLPDCLWLMAQSNPTDLLARLRTVEAERDGALEVLARFEDEENDEETPSLAVLALRCFEWGDSAWYQTHLAEERAIAAESRVEALEAALKRCADWPLESSRFELEKFARAALAVSGNQPQ